jgi:hypothetical protein
MTGRIINSQAPFESDSLNKIYGENECLRALMMRLYEGNSRRGVMGVKEDVDRVVMRGSADYMMGYLRETRPDVVSCDFANDPRRDTMKYILLKESLGRAQSLPVHSDIAADYTCS